MAKLEMHIHENTSATKNVAPYFGTFASKGTINFADDTMISHSMTFG